MSGRNVLALVFAVLGGMATFAAAVAIYAHHVFVDRNGFADTVTEVVKQPAVSREIAVRMSDALVNAKPDVIAGQRLIEDAASSLISGGTLDAIVHRAALELHDAVFEGGAEQFALDLSDGLQLLTSVVATQDPELRTDLSGALDATVGGLTRNTWISRLEHVERFIDELAIGLPILALTFFVAAIAVARDRRRAIGWVGWSIALAGPALFLFGATVDVVVRGRGWVNPDAVDQTVRVFLSGAKWVALVLGLAGAAIAAAASGRLRTDTADRAASRTWRYLLRAPEGRWPRVFRAVVLLGAGALLLVSPALAVQVLVVAVGFLAVVEGLTEIIAALVGAAPGTTTAAGEPASSSHRRRLVTSLAVAVGVLGLAALGAVALTRAPQSDASVGLGCNGSEELCDRPVDRVAFPTAHNAMSSAEDGFVDPNHRRSLVQQLDAGIRGLLVDSIMARPTDRPSSALTVLDGEVRETARREVGESGTAALQDFLARRLASPTGPPKPYLCHIVCELGALPMEEELTKIREWLDRNPHEVLVIVIQDLVSPQETERVFRASGLFDRVWAWNTDDPAPTLRQMIDANRRVLVMAEKDGLSEGWYQAGYERLLKETPYDTATVEGLRSDESCRPNRGKESNPLFLVNHWAAVYPPRPSKAAIVNQRAFLRDRVDRCRKIRAAFPNLIAVDFAGIGDVVRVAAEINGTRPS
jgi:hypothetical protein